MKKLQKTQDQIEAERREARELAAEIIEMSNRIPAKIRNEASHGTAVAYKNHMMAALKCANGKILDVHKLRAAYNLIVGYYKG